MFKKKIFGLIVVSLFFMSYCNIPLIFAQDTDEQFEENSFILYEQSIDNATQNDSFRENLSVKENKTFDFIKDAAKTDNTQTVEILSTIQNLYGDDKDAYNCFLSYVNDENGTRAMIDNNPYLKEKVGYYIKYIKKWPTLSLKEKMAFFDNNKHDLNHALHLMDKVSQDELLYINGHLINDPYGYSNFYAELQKIVSMGSSADKGEMERLSNVSDRLADEVFHAHVEFLMLNESDKKDFHAILKDFYNRTGDKKKMIHDLENMVDDFDSVNDLLDGIHHTQAVQGGVLVGIGAAMIITGVALILVGTLASGLTAGASTILIGLGGGLIITGIMTVAFGSPATDQAVKLDKVRGKTRSVSEEFKSTVQIIIDQLNEDSTT